MTKTPRVLTDLAASAFIAGSAAYAEGCGWGMAYHSTADQMAEAEAAPVLQSAPTEEVVASVNCDALSGDAKATCLDAAALTQ